MLITNFKIYTTEPFRQPLQFSETHFTAVPSIYAQASLGDNYLSYFSQNYVFVCCVSKAKDIFNLIQQPEFH